MKFGGPDGESNPELEFAKLVFSQLNYQPIYFGLAHRSRTCILLAPNEVTSQLAQCEIKTSLLRTLGSNQSNH